MSLAISRADISGYIVTSSQEDKEASLHFTWLQNMFHILIEAAAIQWGLPVFHVNTTNVT